MIFECHVYLIDLCAICLAWLIAATRLEYSLNIELSYLTFESSLKVERVSRHGSSVHACIVVEPNVTANSTL